MSPNSITSIDQATAIESEGSEDQRLDVHIVILINYVRPHHVASYVELAKRVRRLTILLSTPMESNRDWAPEWDGLDVRIQRNWTLTTKRNVGFDEPNYIHFPIDTHSQLKALKPDIVFSYEMGMRTLLSGWYRRFRSRVTLVMVGNMLEHFEEKRGVLRRAVRWLVRRNVDYLTYNGPSCRRYLKSLSISDSKLFHLPYCYDQEVVFDDKRLSILESDEQITRLIYCGLINERKGVVSFTKCLREWCDQNPTRRVEFAIAGSGPQAKSVAALASSNLSIRFLGFLDSTALKNAYGESDICVFPTLGDEWGLVPIEAMASGLPVLGSRLAQSIEATVDEGKTGWVFDPHILESMSSAIESAMACDKHRLRAMGQNARAAVKHISGQATAQKFCDVIRVVLQRKKKEKR